MRSPNCEKIALRKGKWSPEEDDKLVAYIKRYGIWNWNEMPKAAGLSRSGKSCRLRWINYLRPNIKHGNFTKEEEETILNLHQMLGNRWSAIAARLPGRTDNEIKNYWHAHLKKLINDNKSESEAEAEHIFFPITPPHNSISGSGENPSSTADFSKLDNVISPNLKKQ